MIVALVALMVAIFATAAYADTITGNDRNNTLRETSGDDDMFGKGGEDTLLAGQYSGDVDNLYGNGQKDYLDAVDEDTDDFVQGGAGSNDVCWIDKDLNGTSDTSDDTADAFGTGCERKRTQTFNPEMM
jgi:Ca2+-binding RTX toxin-like protein